MILNAQIEQVEIKEPDKAETQQLFPKQPLMTYVNALAKHLRTSEKVINHTVLKSDKWTKSCYDLLSKLITEDLNKNLDSEQRRLLGTSLSSKTLQKIVECKYKISYPIDPRTLNTLNKVVLFLEYKDWNDFTSKSDHITGEKVKNSSLNEQIEQVVQEAVCKEYFAYCCLPQVQEGVLLDNFIVDSPSYNMIMNVLINKSSKNQTISNPYNPSTCEILELEVKKADENYAQIYTKEYWLLCWWDLEKKRYVKRYKVISDHFYILNKEEGVWKIKTNASTSDPMDLE